MLNEDGEPAGIGVELWRLWSQKTGRPIQFRLTDISRSLADLKDGLAEEKGVEMLFHRDIQVPDALIGDPLRLQQVLANLVGNAIKFTGQDEVTVNVHQMIRHGDRVRLRFTVRDTGIGIEPEQVPRLLQAPGGSRSIVSQCRTRRNPPGG